jgi:hypothetical protein
MNTSDARRRWLIELQGMYGLDDATLKAIDWPLRLAPAICLAVVAVGTITVNATIMWALLPFAILGAVLTGHPFDMLYNHGLRHLTGGPQLPDYGLPRRAACAMASFFIAAIAWCFASGAVVTGEVLGGILMAVAFINISTGFCIPSFLFRIVTRGVGAPAAPRRDREGAGQNA